MAIIAREKREAARRAAARRAREKASRKKAVVNPLQALWDANGAAIYEANKAFKTKYGKNMSAKVRRKAIKDATVSGVFRAGAYAGNLVKAVTPPPPPNPYAGATDRIRAAANEIDDEKKIGYQDAPLPKKPSYVVPDMSWKRADMRKTEMAAAAKKTTGAKVMAMPMPQDSDKWPSEADKPWVHNPPWNMNGSSAATPTPTPSVNTIGDQVAARGIQFYHDGLPAGTNLYSDGINSNCTIFTNTVLMSVYQKLGLPYIGADSVDFGRTPESQQFYSAQNGEIRFVVNGNSHSQSEILDELQRLGDGALMQGATIYTKTTELYLGEPAVPDIFGHSVLYIGDGQILEMSGPSFWEQNEQGQYIGKDNDGENFNVYNWEPNSSDPITSRSLFDIASSPIETLVKGIPGSSFPNDFTVQRITSEISIVPAQPVNIEDLPNYGINNFDQNTWEQSQSRDVYWAGDKEKTCYLNPATTRDDVLLQYYCPPTVPPSATPTPMP